MAGQKILVTGGTGYIGSHTVVELINSGFEPVIVDNLNNSVYQIIDQIRQITGIVPEFHNFDLNDEQKLRALLDKHPDLDGVIHFAAYKSVGESVAEPLKYYRNNIVTLLNVIDAFGERNVNIVFSSSCTVYGEPDQLPVTESSPVKDAESPYGNTKQVSEEILRDAAQVNKNLKVTALRYFNPVGAHASALIGELPIGVPQNLVPFITQSAIGKRGAITVFGDDYSTQDGSCIRDYIHVVDLAKAHIAALKRMKTLNNGGSFDIYNVGTGTGSSVLQVINEFESSTGVKLDYRIGPRRSGDIEKIYGDVTKAGKELGWKTELGLTEMMSSAWAWENYIKNNPF